MFIKKSYSISFTLTRTWKIISYLVGSMLGSWFLAQCCSWMMIKKMQGSASSGFLCVFLYYIRVSLWRLFKKGWYACLYAVRLLFCCIGKCLIFTLISNEVERLFAHLSLSLSPHYFEAVAFEVLNLMKQSSVKILLLGSSYWRCVTLFIIHLCNLLKTIYGTHT